MQSGVQQWDLKSGFAVLKSMTLMGGVHSTYFTVPFNAGKAGIRFCYNDTISLVAMQGAVKDVDGVPYLYLSPDGWYCTCTVISVVDSQGGGTDGPYYVITPTPEYNRIPLNMANGHTCLYCRSLWSDPQFLYNGLMQTPIVVNWSRVTMIETIYSVLDEFRGAKSVSQQVLLPTMRCTINPTIYYSTEFMNSPPTAAVAGGSSKGVHRPAAVVKNEKKKEDSDDDDVVVMMTEEQRLEQTIRKVLAEGQKDRKRRSDELCGARVSKVSRSLGEGGGAMIPYGAPTSLDDGGAVVPSSELARMIKHNLEMALQNSPVITGLQLAVQDAYMKGEAAEAKATVALETARETKTAVADLQSSFQAAQETNTTKLDRILAETGKSTQESKAMAVKQQNLIDTILKSLQVVAETVDVLAAKIPSQAQEEKAAPGAGNVPNT